MGKVVIKILQGSVDRYTNRVRCAKVGWQ